MPTGACMIDRPDPARIDAARRAGTVVGLKGQP